jgi:hypothetical protein
MKKLLFQLTFVLVAAFVNTIVSAQVKCCTTPIEKTTLSGTNNDVSSTDMAVKTQADSKSDYFTKVEDKGDYYLLTAVIENTGILNNAASCIRATIQLPAESPAVSYKLLTKAKGINIKHCYGKIEVALEQMGRKPSPTELTEVVIEVKVVKSKKPNTEGKENFAIFVTNDVPDFLLANNFWVWKTNP